MTFKEIEKILLRDGWYRYKIVGSHYQYKHNVKKSKNNNTKTLQRIKERDLKFNIKTGRIKKY